jgi:uncharacterized protein (DUF1800 family)
MTSLSSPQDIFHVSNRLTFGMSIKDINKINKIGVNSYIKEQLNPQSIDVKDFLASDINEYEGFRMNISQIFNSYQNNYIVTNQKKQNLSAEQKKQRGKETMKERRNFINKTLDFKIYKSINNPRQLEEIMTDFWFNHFNVFMNKPEGIQAFLINNYEQKAIQPHALGKFRDLLEATAQHPSMLYYLDNWKNVVPVAAKEKDKKSSRGLNENYARELMELHTLGVNGGYTQDDVINLARILTGWGIMNPNTPQSENGFYFNEKLHDYGDKNFLGHKIKGSGIEEINQALDILAYHPATANYISYKLVQFFLTDNPPDNLIKKLAKTFLDTEGNIKIVLAKLFESEQFWDVKYYGNKFKTPYQYLISVLRIADIQKPPFNPIISTLGNLQMRPYYCVTPDGYKNTQEAWLSSDGIMKRVSFALNVGEGKLNKKSKINSTQLVKNFTNFLSDKTIKAMKNKEQKWQSALILGSPEMMYK